MVGAFSYLKENLIFIVDTTNQSARISVLKF
ncbi:hypothetical protein VP424E501_P0233 [Vibrio phage 424E50-1]|nr:hypothetical protein VP501E541_P0220 [Vibrio phage 501E54-1]CAH9014658.1 hypothetical protein VP424E501_P0233 [Vibrio phage 424E50-1]